MMKSDEGGEDAGTVEVIADSSSLIRNAAEELTEAEDVQTVLIRQTRERQDIERKVRVDHVDARLVDNLDGIDYAAAEEVDDTELSAELQNVEVTEFHEQGELQRGVRNDHREDDQ